MSRIFVAIGFLSVVGSLVAMPSGGLGDDKLPPPSRRELLLSQNNLKQIGLAFHNHNDTYGVIPDDIKSKDGKPLLSWRVKILPFIDQGDLYRQFKLDEPWDSPTNKKLIAKLPKTYTPIRVKAKEGETFYQVFTGEKCVFGAKMPASIPRSFPDGTSNTAFVFEAGEPVIWTKPQDMLYDPKKPLPKLGGLFDGDFHVGKADGSVILCKKDADPIQIHSLITPAGGEILEEKKLKK